MADCSNGAQASNWCPSTAAEALPMVLGLLPSGPAWDGARESGTVMNQFWTAVAALFAWVYSTLCAYQKEFLCTTAVYSLDQWAAEYGLPDQCDPYAYNLCTKVNELFEPTGSSFVAVAKANGWVVSCNDTPIPEPVAGCFECGCTPLGPLPEFVGASNLGVGALSPCDYGSVVQHPQPWFWNNALTSQASCVVPGTNLGFGPDVAVDEPCCFVCGWMPAPDIVAPSPPTPDACSGGDTIYFDCPTYVRPALVLDPASLGQDSTGQFTNYSQRNVWTVTLYLTDSLALQGQGAPTGPTSQAGNLEAGCTPTCSLSPYNDVLCFLQTIAPAHTVLMVNVAAYMPAGQPLVSTGTINVEREIGAFVIGESEI
jgi:hypothetical protein